MAACTLAVASLTCATNVDGTCPVECRSCRVASPARCMVEWNSEVLTGHEDGCIRFWTHTGEAVFKGTEPHQKSVKMHNTAVTCLVPLSKDQGVWSCSSAGSVRRMDRFCSRTSKECKTPGKKSAHSTEARMSVFALVEFMETYSLI